MDTTLPLEIGGTDPILFSTFHFRSFDSRLESCAAYGKGEKKMKPKNLFIAAGARFVLILVLISAIIVQAGSAKTLYLDWRQVVPAGSGDPNMFGEASVTVNAGQASLCYTLRVFLYPGTDWPPTGASIHNAPAGLNGPLVAELQPNFASETTSGCVNVDSALAHDLQRNPAQYYILVTDASHPEGAARAQLTK
jgi:hypothetical protein